MINLRTCSSTWQIGDRCSYYTDIGNNMESVDAFAKDTFLKHAVAHDILVMDVFIILSLVEEIE